MKKKNFLWMSAAFVAGSVFGITLLGLVSFSGPANPPAAGPTKIDAKVAKAYYLAYIKNAQRYDSVIGGFAIDKDEFTAMNKLLTDVPTLAGFRIYMGIDGSGNNVALMIASDTDGKEVGTNVYSAVRSIHVGPCPPLCDSQSPISGN